MNRKRALDSFKYWGERIYTPTGRKDKKAEIMRALWAKAIDSGLYRKLPDDAIEADEMLWKLYQEGKIEVEEGIRRGVIKKFGGKVRRWIKEVSGDWFKYGWDDPDLVDEWRYAGWDDLEKARRWYEVGWRDAKEALEWYRAGWEDPKEAFDWYEAGWRDPNKALKWKKAGWESSDDAYWWYEEGWKDPEEAFDWYEAGWRDYDPSQALWYKERGYESYEAMEFHEEQLLGSELDYEFEKWKAKKKGEW